MSLALGIVKEAIRRENENKYNQVALKKDKAQQQTQLKLVSDLGTPNPSAVFPGSASFSENGLFPSVLIRGWNFGDDIERNASLEEITFKAEFIS